MWHHDNWLIFVLVKIEMERKDSFSFLTSNNLKSELGPRGIFKGRASFLNVFYAVFGWTLTQVQVTVNPHPLNEGNKNSLKFVEMINSCTTH